MRGRAREFELYAVRARQRRCLAARRAAARPLARRAAIDRMRGPHDARALCSAETRSCCWSWHAARSEIRSWQASVTRLMMRRARQISTRRHAAATTTVDRRRTNRCDGHLTGWTSLARQSATAHRHHWRSLTAHGVRRDLDGDGARRGRLFHHWRRRGRRARARSGAGKVMKKAGADFRCHVDSAGARAGTERSHPRDGGGAADDGHSAPRRGPRAARSY